MFYVAEVASPYGHFFDRWIFVPLSVDARQFIEGHSLILEGKGVKKDEDRGRWELTFDVAAEVTQDAFARKLKAITPDKLNYLKSALK
jgi:hypothetical protein